MVSVVVRVLMDVFGSGFFGSGNFIIFRITAGQETFYMAELLPMLLLGILGGLLGSGLNAAHARLLKWRRRHLHVHGLRARMYEGLALALLTSSVSFVLPLMSACRVS